MQQHIEIETPRGIMRGYFHRPNKDSFPVCIIFHGFTGQKTGTKFSYVQISRQLEKQGIGSLRMDFLGSGESDLGFENMTFSEELKEAIIQLEKVLEMPEVTEIYVLGHSMGGAIASEVAKRYPQIIQRLCLWAPAYSLPATLRQLQNERQSVAKGIYDHGGFKISEDFVEDIISWNLYKDLGIYQNKLLVIHGTKDTTVPYAIHKKYLRSFTPDLEFLTIPDGDHNFDKLADMNTVMDATLQFLI